MNKSTSERLVAAFKGTELEAQVQDIVDHPEKNHERLLAKFGSDKGIEEAIRERFPSWRGWVNIEEALNG